MTSLPPGARVRHATWGEGTVERGLAPGLVLVRFDSGRRLPLIERNLSRVEAPAAPAEPEPALFAPAPAPPVQASPTPPAAASADRGSSSPDGSDSAEVALALSPSQRLSAEQVRSRQALEALRVGIVPEGRVQQVTVGRDEEMAAITEAIGSLRERQGEVLFFRERNGGGKSHMLTLAGEIALRRNCVVMRADLEAARPEFPKEVYRRFASNVRLPGDPAQYAVRDLLERAADKGVSWADFQDVPPLAQALRVASRWSTRTADDWSALWAWIEGEEIPAATVREAIQEKALQALPSTRTSANVYCNLLNGFARLAQAMGYEGLVLLIDEAERIHLTSGPVAEEYAEGFLAGLAYLALGQRAPYAEADLPASTRRLKEPLPFRPYDAPVLLVVGFTTMHHQGLPLRDDRLPEAYADDHVFDLQPVSKDDLRELFARIAEQLHAGAYGYPLPTALADATRLPPAVSGFLDLLHARMTASAPISIRVVVQSMVDVLDLAWWTTRSSGAPTAEGILANVERFAEEYATTRE